MTKTDAQYDDIRRKRDSLNKANGELVKDLESARAELEFVTMERDRVSAQLQAEQGTMREVIADNSANNDDAVKEVMRLRKLLQDNGIEIGG